MTNEAIGTLAALALVLALASGARAGWRTQANTERTVKIRGGETWRVVFESTAPFDAGAEAAFRKMIAGVADVVSLERSADARTVTAVLQYNQDAAFVVNRAATLGGAYVTVTDAEKVEALE